MPFVDRDSFIALLDQLRSEDEAAVVAAAREINRRMDEGNVTWDDVLAPLEGATPSHEDEFFDDDEEHDAADDADDVDDADEDAPDDAEGPVDTAADDAADEEPVSAEATGGDKALIDKLLARQGLAETTREELEAFKTDIAEGDFTAADSKYLKALAARLDGGTKTKPSGRRKR